MNFLNWEQLSSDSWIQLFLLLWIELTDVQYQMEQYVWWLKTKYRDVEARRDVFCGRPYEKLKEGPTHKINTDKT